MNQASLRQDSVEALFEWDAAEFKGSGGFADVYAALCKKGYDGENPELALEAGETYAIKVISKSRVAHQTDFWKRCMHEVSILLRIDHPCCVSLYDVFQDDSNVYLVLELVDGGELFDVCADGEISENDAAHIVKQLLKACRYLHSQQIVHRDIKLENILVSKDLKSVRLIDFGLAKFFGRSLKRHATPGGGTGGTFGNGEPQPLPETPPEDEVPPQEESSHQQQQLLVPGLGMQPQPLPPSPTPGQGEDSFPSAPQTQTFQMSAIGLTPQPLPPSPGPESQESSFSRPRDPFASGGKQEFGGYLASPPSRTGTVTFSGPPPDAELPPSSPWHTYRSGAQSLFISTPCGTVDYLAPEVLSHLVNERIKPRYTTRAEVPKLDIFAVGVVCYLVLGGSLSSAPEMDINSTSQKLKNMEDGTFFTQEYFGEVSDEAKEFCSKLLHPNAKERISAEDALQHVWLAGYAPNKRLCSVPSGYLDKSYNAVLIDNMRKEDDDNSDDEDAEELATAYSERGSTLDFGSPRATALPPRMAQQVEVGAGTPDSRHSPKNTFTTGSNVNTNVHVGSNHTNSSTSVQNSTPLDSQFPSSTDLEQSEVSLICRKPQPV
eukprot:TRINITY_DN14803_c0_g1_i1.p1 TRINITY_DN14803_c0_g1~~TRINITY_DN14803_c0_g1_i1.p1  ORF type:complete len:612 (-),score=26.54 TRINITY_DN14803_c0_g1_i1:60-1874(-)